MLNTDVRFSLTEEERETLNQQTKRVVDSTRQSDELPEELKNVGRLLEANAANLNIYKNQVWFQKAWILISGTKGWLTEISINNLGQVQVGVLKVLGDLMEDSTADKARIASLYQRIKTIQARNNIHAKLLLKFNEKYEQKFVELWREVRYTRWLSHILAGVIGLALLVGAGLGVQPALNDTLRYALISGGVAVGLILLIISVRGLARRSRRQPLQFQRQAPAAQPQSSKGALPAATLRYLGLPIDGQEEVDSRVFKLKPHEKTLRGYVDLTPEEGKLLFSMEYYLTHRDIGHRDNGIEREKAERWLNAWSSSIEQANRFDIVRDEATLFRGIAEVSEDNLAREKRGILLFEAMLFRPYFNIEIEEFKQMKIEVVEKLLDDEVREFSRKLNCPYGLLEDAKKAYEEALREIAPSSFWKKLAMALVAGILLAMTAGAAAPVVGGLIGSAFFGLSGVAAVNAGLALLGGGALAVGGFGVAGGTLLIIGGGTVLGAGVGAGLGSLLEKSHALALSQLAKMEAVLQALLRPLANSKDLFSEAISLEIAQFKELKSRIDAMESGKQAVTGSALAEAKRSAACFERAIGRLEDFRRQNY